MFRLYSSLRFRLILIVLLAVLPAIVLILYTGFEERQNSAARAQTDTRRLVELASMHQERLVEEAHRLLMTLSQNTLVRTGDRQPCSAYLAELLTRQPHYLNFGLADADGSVLCSALPFESSVNLSDRDYFLRAIQGGGFAIGSCQVGYITGKTSINFGYPVRDAEGVVRAVVFAAVDLAWLTDLTEHLKLPTGSSLTVVGREGVIIARYPEPQRWVGKIIPDAEILRAVLNQEKEGLTEAAGIDGVRRLYAFTPLDGFPHSTFLYTGIPTGTVYNEANRALTRNLIALGVVSTLALLAAHLFGHLFVMNRVNALVTTARQLAAGDLSARTDVGSGTCELNQLGMVLNEMAEALERRGNERVQMEEALRRSEDKFRTLVEQIPVVTYVAALDESRTTIYISPQVESLLGFDQEDFVEAPDTWIQTIHPEDRERVLQEVFRCQQENDLFVCEYRMLTFNSLVKWIRDEAVVVFSDADEPLFMQGVVTDITEQKKTEDALRKAHDELELRVEQRTEQLAQANEDLRRSGERLKFFAYSVVHDLKSPAIGTYGITRLLQKQYANVLDEKAREYCNQIMRASEHMAELVQMINAYIATKETPLTIDSVSIAEIVGVLRDEFSPKLKPRGIKWFEPETEIEVMADRLSLLRVFRNCVDNALKYGGDQLSEIRIGHQELDDHHVFSVSDDGHGLNEKDAEKIFEVFQRNSTSIGVEGAGLGLAIVKEIADQHGGQVWVESSPEKGTTFYLSIAKDLHRQVKDDCEDAA